MKKTTKLLITMLIIITVLFGLVACGGETKIKLVFINGDTQLTTVTITGDLKPSDLPTPPVKEGYTFYGWFTAENIKLETAITQLASGTTQLKVFAKWIIIPRVEVTFMNGDTQLTTVTITGDLKPSDLPTPPVKEGYIFDGWFTAENIKLETAITQLASGTTQLKVFAKWKFATYVNITYKNGDITVATIKADGAIGQLPTPPVKEGYTFDGWFTAENVKLETAFAQLAPSVRGLTVFAKWRLDGLNNVTLDNNCDEVFYQSDVVLTVANLIENTNFNYLFGWSHSTDGINFTKVNETTKTLTLNDFVADVGSKHYYHVSVTLTDENNKTEVMVFETIFTVKPIIATVAIKNVNVDANKVWTTAEVKDIIKGLRTDDVVAGSLSTIGIGGGLFTFKGETLPSSMSLSDLTIKNKDGVDITKYYTIKYDLAFTVQSLAFAKDILAFDFEGNASMAVDKAAIFSQLLPDINMQNWTVELIDFVSKTEFANVPKGSTYCVTVSAKYGAFELSEEIIIKYKSVLFSDTLYTIEDALNECASGTIIVKFNTAFAAKEVGDICYTGLGYYTIQNGVTLLVPYDANYKTTLDDNVGKAVTTSFEYVTLSLPTDIKLTVNGILTVNATKGYALPYGGFPSGGYGLLNLNDKSEVVVEDGGAVHCNGYITGAGIVTAKSGATVFDVIFIEGFRGGTCSSKLNTNKIFPFDEFSFQNIETKIIINAGAKYSVRGFVMPTVAAVIKEIIVIGSDNTALFTLKNGYIEKTFNINTAKVGLSMFGDVEVNPISLSVGVAVKTANTDFSIPGNIDINVEKDTFTIKSATYIKVLGSAGFYVSQGATVILENDARLSAYGENEMTYIVSNNEDYAFKYSNRTYYMRVSPAQQKAYTYEDKGTIANYGTIISEKGSSLGGVIETSGSGAILKTAENSVTIKVLTSNSPFTLGQNILTLKGNSDDGIVQLAPNAVYKAVDGKWVAEKSNINFNFNTAGVNSETLIQSFGENVNLPTEPSKAGYKFVGWSQENIDGQTFVESSNFITANSMVDRNILELYAIWAKSTVTITFDTKDGALKDNLEISGGSAIDLETDHKPTLMHNDFHGWFLDTELTKPFDGSKEITNDITVYAKWIKQLRITYFEAEGGGTTSKEAYLEKRVLPNLYKDNAGYITVWFFSQDMISKYIYQSANYVYTGIEDNLVEDMTLYAFKFFELTTTAGKYEVLTKATVDAMPTDAKNIFVTTYYNIDVDAFRDNANIEIVVSDTASIKGTYIYPTDYFNTSVEAMPNALITVGAFSGCSNLTTVIFNKSTSIPGFAFWNCPKLVKVIATDGLKVDTHFGFVGADNKTDRVYAFAFGGIAQIAGTAIKETDVLIKSVTVDGQPKAIFNDNLKIYMDFDKLQESGTYSKIALAPYKNAGNIVQKVF